MLAEWLLRSLTFAAVLCVGGLLVERARRGSGGRVRGIWLCVLLTSVMIPCAAWFAPDAWPAGLRRSVTIAAAMTADSGTEAVGAAAGSRLSTDAALWASWLALSLFVTLRYAHGWASLRRARRSWRRGRCCDTDVLVSDEVGPALVGLLRPTIVTPAWLLAATPDQQRMAVLHEYEHARARDHWLLALAPLLVCAMPWNVPLWWQLRRLRLAIELDCDRRVLARGVEPVAYGSMLLDIAGGARVWAAAALAEPRSLLSQRIEALSGAARLPVAARALLTLGGGAALLLGAAVTAPADIRVAAAAPAHVGDAMPRHETARAAAVVLRDSAVGRGEVERRDASVTHAGADAAPLTTTTAAVRRDSTAARVLAATDGTLPAPRVSPSAAPAPLRILPRPLLRTGPRSVRDPTMGSDGPLIIVDGVIVSRGLRESGLESMDISSIEVLKGAAAARLYGTRAAAGVIMITTRRDAGER